MEHILITGLDGSGKSTILNALAKLKTNNSFDVVLLPLIDSESLNKDPKLQAAAIFVNRLSHEADLLKIPQLKAIAIFVSMLLFNELARHKSTPGIKTLYCERHPLIDTSIYAQFYAGKMGEGDIDKDHVIRIDNSYKKEIEYITRLIPKGTIRKRSKSIAFLAEFLLQWFFIEGKLDIADLRKLFHVELPSKIYYLKADPEVLMQRLAGRGVYEAHENLEVLTKLSRAYDDLFISLSDDFPGIVEVINAGNAMALIEFQERLTKNYK